MTRNAVEDVLYTPVITASGTPGRICEDCWARDSPQASRRLAVTWVVFSAVTLIFGTYQATQLKVTQEQVAKLLSSGGIYGSLTVLAAISVAGAVAAGQITKEQQRIDQTIEGDSTVLLQSYLERSRLDAGFMGELIAVFFLGTVSGTMASMLVMTMNDDPAQALAAVIALTLTLWIALEFARLLASSRPPDRLMPQVLHRRLRTTKQRLNGLIKDTRARSSGSFMAAVVALIIISVASTATQCSLAKCHGELLIRGIMLLSGLLLLAVLAICVGHRALLSDHSLWATRSTLVIASLTFVGLCVGAYEVSQHGLLGTVETNRVARWAMLAASAGSAAIIICLILWGSAGYGVCRSLATAQALAFISSTDGIEETSSGKEPGRRRIPLTRWVWVPWALLPTLGVIQAYVDHSATGQPLATWLPARAVVTWLLFAALGRLSLAIAGRVRYLLTGMSVIGQLVATSAMTMASGTHQLPASILVLVIGLLATSTYLFLFGPFPGRHSGMMSRALNAQMASRAQAALQSLTVKLKANASCPNPGCINSPTNHQDGTPDSGTPPRTDSEFGAQHKTAGETPAQSGETHDKPDLITMQVRTEPGEKLVLTIMVDNSSNVASSQHRCDQTQTPNGSPETVETLDPRRAPVHVELALTHRPERDTRNGPLSQSSLAGIARLMAHLRGHLPRRRQQP